MYWYCRNMGRISLKFIMQRFFFSRIFQMMILVKSMPGMLLRQQQKVIPLILHWLRFSDVLTMYMLIVTCLNLLLVMMVLPSLHVDIVGDSFLLYLLAGVYLRKLSLNL